MLRMISIQQQVSHRLVFDSRCGPKMKTVLFCTIALFATIESFVVNNEAEDMYHVAPEETRIETEEPSKDLEADLQTELTPSLAERTEEQSDAAVPFLKSIPPSPFRDYYPFVEYPGLPSPAFVKSWENMEYGPWGALRFALDQAPLTPAGTFKLDSFTKYRLWKPSNAQQESEDDVEDM